MRWASALSRLVDPAAAFQQAAEEVARQLDGRRPHLLLAFLSPGHAEACGRIARLAEGRFPGALLVGCTAAGVIGGAEEVETGPALSLTAASLPGVDLEPLRLGAGELPEPAGGDARSGTPPSVLLLADPFTIDAAAVIDALDRDHPGAPTFGGLASGVRAPGESRLLLRTEVHDGGAVGIVFRGALEVETLVAQGCRPVGAPMRVTRCDRTLLRELDGRPPLQVLAELHDGLGARDRELMHHSLFVGLEMRPEGGQGVEGELLVRNLLGVDQGTGVIAVGADLRPSMVAQFVLRDAHAAEAELRSLLSRRRRAAGGRPAGALLFSCTGRGEGLFGHPGHDSDLFEEQLGPAPLGGFFCNGEIGPVGGRTYLHGYTSAFALFREPGASAAAP